MWGAMRGEMWGEMWGAMWGEMWGAMWDAMWGAGGDVDLLYNCTCSTHSTRCYTCYVPACMVGETLTRCGGKSLNGRAGLIFWVMMSVHPMNQGTSASDSTY